MCSEFPYEFIIQGDTLNERINELRKTLGLTMEKFGERLGVGKSAINKLEKAENSVTDQMFKSICREFDVNEEWLRNGTGCMFRTLTRSEVITDFTADLLKDEEESFQRRFIEALATLDADDWKTLEKLSEKLQKK